MERVRYCPFCGEKEIVNVSKNDDGREIIFTFCCEDCGGMFTVKVYNIDGILKSDENSETCTTCTDDELREPVDLNPEEYKQLYEEARRELEKTKYLLDLSVKEGMKNVG